nr:hypothetical protein [Tanacetum cinerariifolium]
MKYEDIRPIFERAGFDLQQESSKKQRLDQQIEQTEETEEEVKVQGDNDQELENIKLYMRIVPDEYIAINAIPLATRPLVIIEYKIVKEGKINTYHDTIEYKLITKEQCFPDTRIHPQTIEMHDRNNKKTNVTSQMNVVKNKNHVENVNAEKALKANVDVLCVLCDKNVLVPYDDECFEKYKLSVNAKFRKSLFTTPKTVKSKSVDTTPVVAKTSNWSPKSVTAKMIWSVTKGRGGDAGSGRDGICGNEDDNGVSGDGEGIGIAKNLS